MMEENEYKEEYADDESLKEKLKTKETSETIESSRKCLELMIL